MSLDLAAIERRAREAEERAQNVRDSEDPGYDAFFGPITIAEAHFADDVFALLARVKELEAEREKLMRVVEAARIVRKRWYGMSADERRLAEALAALDAAGTPPSGGREAEEGK